MAARVIGHIARVLALLGWALAAQAQQAGQACVVLPLPGHAVYDSLPLRLHTLQAFAWPSGEALPQGSVAASFDPSTRTLRLDPAPGTAALPDSVLACFQHWPAGMEALQHRQQPANDTAQYLDELARQTWEAPAAPDFITLQGLGGEPMQANGQLARGLSLGSGNAQDVAVNSSLQLQLEGPIAPGLQLTASISDQQVPFQPDGNTQQLQDFDRILLRLEHERGWLQAGDLQLQQDSAAHFLRFFKNVQGLQAQANWRQEAGKAQRTQMALSSAKGQFHSQQVAPVEGVQGPYRLRGAQQERFIVVVAGSERVFVDGEPLSRGFDADYTIDYNQAEITFTNRIIITQFTRIRVDFEYAAQQYSRRIVQGLHDGQGHALLRGKRLEWAYGMRFYQEQDNPNAPLLADVGAEAREALRLAGDSLELAVVPAWQPSPYTPNQVLYALRDTAADGLRYQAFVRAEGDRGEALFQVGFSEVGPGLGDYVLEPGTANGRVYRWVAPVQGMPQGDHSPTRRIPAPNRKQLAEANFRAKHGNGQAYGSLALSDHDANRLSERGNADNRGVAGRLGYARAGRVGQARWRAYAEGELHQRDFRPIDRFRGVEFDRLWSLQELGTGTERLLTAGGEWVEGKRLRLRYQAARRRRDGAVDGWQQEASGRWQAGGWRAQADGRLLDARLPDGQNADWRQLSAQAARKGRLGQASYRFELDEHAVSAGDSATQSLMHFRAHTWRLQTADSLRWQVAAQYQLRTDRKPLEGSILPWLRAQTLQFSAKKQAGRERFEATLSYRHLRPLQGGDPASGNLMARLDWDQALGGRVFRYSLRYSTAAGQELRREFVYLPVDVGTGTHLWRDDNGDGLQDLSEFYLAQFPDERRYAKFFVPTDGYVQAYTTQLTAQGQLQAPASWRGASERWKAWLGKWSAQANVSALQRLGDGPWLGRLWPWSGRAEAISGRSTARWAAFFNRGSARYGGEYQGRQSRLRQLLTTGMQESAAWEQEISGRWGLGSRWVLRLAWIWGGARQFAEALPAQQYEIGQRRWEPSVEYQPSPKLRLSAVGAWGRKRGQDNLGSSRLGQGRAGLQLRWTPGTKGMLSASLLSAWMRLEGAANTPLGYDLLEGLQPGQNWQWEGSWNQQLANGLQVSFRYAARRPAGRAVVHFGNVQVAAVF